MQYMANRQCCRRLFHCNNTMNKAVGYGNFFLYLFTLLEKQTAGRSQGGGSSSQVI